MRASRVALRAAESAKETVKAATAQDKGSIVPLVLITGATAVSMAVWWRRKASQDPELRSPDTRSAGMPQQPGGGVEQGYGRASAEKSGLMEGDRPYQGIFPTKKITDAMEGVLPASKEGHPTKDPEVKGGKY